MNSYELSRNWFDWCFENPEKITPTHTAMYFFIIEHCNRMGWKEKFGLPMQMTKDALGISNYRTYSKVFNDLSDWGFIKIVQKSKNQYSSSVIAIVKNTKATTKALDKAMQKQSQKQVHDTVCIDKPNNLEPINQLTDSVVPTPVFNFKKSLIDYGFDPETVEDWLKVRKTKKATNSKIAFNDFIKEVEKSKYDKNEILKTCVIKSWAGFEEAWMLKVNPLQNGKSNPYPVKTTPKFSLATAINQQTNSGETSGGLSEDAEFTVVE